MSVNKVILVGNLGADPETRTTQNGTQVANLRIATNERVKKGESWEDHTEWHKVVVWGRMAENVRQFLRKGRQVYIEGRLRTRKWTDNNGVEKYSTEIVGDRVHFLGSKDSDGSGGGGNSNGGGGGYDGGPDDDIPF